MSDDDYNLKWLQGEYEKMATENVRLRVELTIANEMTHEQLTKIEQLEAEIKGLRADLSRWNS